MRLILSSVAYLGMCIIFQRLASITIKFSANPSSPNPIQAKLQQNLSFDGSSTITTITTTATATTTTTPSTATATAMMEFFTRPCPSALAPLKSLTAQFAEKTALPSLPDHIHQVLGAFAVYHAIFLFISPALSRRVVPSFYNKFPPRTKVNWDVHVVSFVQSSFICALALWSMVADKERAAAGSHPGRDGALYRIFGYTTTGAAVQGYAAGYFLWDLILSVYYVDIMGLGFVAHALSALAVYGLGFVPLTLLLVLCPAPVLFRFSTATLGFFLFFIFCFIFSR